MKMDDTADTPAGSIMNYFQREKSPEVTKIGALKKSEKSTENPISLDLKEDTLHVGEKCLSSSENTDDPLNEHMHINETEQPSCCVVDNNIGELKTNARSDYIEGNKYIIKDGNNLDARHSDGFENNVVSENEHSGKKEKSTWSFTWKSKTKKAKTIEACPDSDSDFETNSELTETGSKPCAAQERITKSKSKTQRNKVSKIKGKRTKPSAKMHDTKTNKISDSTNEKNYKLQLSLAPESNNCAGQSRRDLSPVQSITESSSNERGTCPSTDIQDKKCDEVTDSTNTQTSELQNSISPESDVAQSKSDLIHVQSSIDKSSSGEIKTSLSTNIHNERRDEVMDSTNIQTSLSPESGNFVLEPGSDLLHVQSVADKSSSNERETRSLTKVNDDKCDEVVDSSSTETSKLKILLSPESNNCVLESESDVLHVHSVTESSSIGKSGKNIEGASGKVLLEACANIQPESICESTKPTKSGSESTKGSYFDILMQCSRDKARAKQNSEREPDNDCCENAKGSKIDDSARNSGKKEKACKTSRRKKNTSTADNVCTTDDEEAAFSGPRKKQNRSRVKDAKQNKNEAKQKVVRKSTRRNRSVSSPEAVSESNLKEAVIPVNIASSSGEDRIETNPATRSRRTTTLVKTMSRRKEHPGETTKVICLGKQLDSEEKIQFPKEQESALVPQTDCQEDNKPAVEVSNQSDKEDGKGNCEESISTEQKRGKRKRLRKRNILDSDEDDAGSTKSQKETKFSTVETSKSKNNNQPVTKGPIAPIFLPGAWRRAKAKLEEVERLEAAASLDVVETEQDPSPLRISQNLPTRTECDNLVVDLSQHSAAANETAASMSAFLGMFQKPLAKSCTVVVEFIEAPFPKVSHVRQQDDEINDKWNLSMVRNRFVKQEHFVWPDNYNSMIERNLSSWLFGTGISSSDEDTAANSKCIQWKIASFEMDKSKKQTIVSYLKTIYQGIPMKRLFKRCQRQLEMCEKSQVETENVGPLILMTEYFKQTSCIKQPTLPASNFTTPETSTQVSGKSESFTKISRKKSTAKVKAKLVKKKESPLLLAFKKQENAASDKKRVVVSAKPKKSRAKKTSIMDFMGIQTKQSENIPENKPSAQSKKRKNNTGSKVDGKQQNEKLNGGGRRAKECKKRARESEDDGSKSCVAEETVRPIVKKVKLLSSTQEFKKPRRGQKRKLRIVETKENTDVVDIKNGETKSLENPLKCRKISSDDDFVKPPPRRSQENSKCKLNTSNEGSGTETRCLRKSRRLQEKSSVEEADTQVETCDGNGSDVIYVNTESLIQSEQIQKNEEDIKGVQDIAPVPVVDNTCAEQSSAGDVIAGTGSYACAEQSSCSDVIAGTGSCVSSVLWSECFKPRNSMEILGNNNSGTRLKNWLSEWKTLRERKLEAMKRHEEKKRQRLAAKTVSKETSSSWWYDDDDSDFYSSGGSDDDFCDEDNVRNTMLLSGPVGCGKTSAVYACAEELGFKVIEVNSSTKRGGKYILSELLEATQSHQVSTKRNLPPGQSQLFPDADSNAHDSGKKEKEKESRKGKKDTKRAKRPKKKDDDSKDSQLQGQMSLILLDEVDVLFEEDKGFWVSVNTLRQNSKRPIVMTASDTSAVDVDGEFEHIILKSPSLKLYAAHLQTICLIKNIFVNPSDILALSWLHHGDIRRLLLSLQFWLDSNAGASDKHGVIVRSGFGTGADEISVVTNENPPDKTNDISSEKLCEDKCNSVGIALSSNTQDKCDVEINATTMELAGSKTNAAAIDVDGPQINSSGAEVTEPKINSATLLLEIDGPKINAAGVEVTEHTINSAAIDVAGPQINSAGVEVTKPKINAAAIDIGGPHINSADVEITGPKINSAAIDISGPQINSADVEVTGPKINAAAIEVAGPKIDAAGVEVTGPKINSAAIDISGPQINSADVEVTGPKINAAAIEVAGPKIDAAGVKVTGPKINSAAMEVDEPNIPSCDAKKPSTVDIHQLCEKGQSTSDEISSLEKNDIEMHKLCLESLLGLRNVNNNVVDVLETLKSDLNTQNSFHKKCLVTSHCQSLNIDTVYCNLETLFPCVFCSVNTVEDRPMKTQIHKDHPASDMFQDAAQESKGCESSGYQGDEGMEDESCVNVNPTSDEARIHDEDIISKKVVGISLECLEQVYEDMSFMDSELCYTNGGTSWQGFDSWSATISPGLNDTVGKDHPRQITWKTTSVTNELRGALEVASLEHSHKRFHDLCNRNGEGVRIYASELMSGSCCSLESQDTARVSDMDVTDSCADSKANCAHSVAVHTKIYPRTLDARPCLQVTTSTESLSSKIRKREQDYTTISSYLLETSHLNRSTIVIDYLPSLRTICRNESLRRAARVKRRFYHYLDSIGLNLSSSVLQSLIEDGYFNVI